MNPSRRTFLAGSTAAGMIAGLGPRAVSALAAPVTLDPASGPLPPGRPGLDYRPVVTPNNTALPFKIVGDVKVFHLVAERVDHEFAPGLRAQCMGFNGAVHGPTIEAVEGDRVRIYVTNKIDVPTSIHWHGLVVPNGMDGVGGLTQRPIAPGETFKYEFTLVQHGSYMYHSHHDEMTQMALGLMGLFVIHPRNPDAPSPDRDYAYMLSEWKITPGTSRPDPNEMMDFNVLTLNGKIFPATESLVARRGERVRIRFGNLSAMDHHPMHLHGHAFSVVATDGGVVPESARWPEVTVIVPVGSTRTIEFVADQLGDWALHCHMTHHVMNQMGHGTPILDGIDPSLFDEKVEKVVPEFADMGVRRAGDVDTSVPRNSLPMIGGKGGFGYTTMSGMVTVLKVREALEPGLIPGWYEHPAGTVADRATPEEMRADGL